MQAKTSFLAGLVLGAVAGAGGVWLLPPDAGQAAATDVHRVAGMALQASAVLAVERGLTFTALHDSEALDAPARAALVERRASVDAHLDQLLNTLPQENVSGVRAQLRRDVEKLAEARARVDTGLAVPRVERKRLLAQEWFSAATGALESLGALTSQFEKNLDEESAATRLFRIETYALAMSEAAGRERAILAAAIQSAQPFSAHQSRILRWLRFNLASDWQRVSVIVQAFPDEPRLQQAAADVQQQYFTGIWELATGIHEASATQTPYPLSVDAWFERSSRAIDTIVALGSAAAQIAARRPS